jgi:hypothetical protein
MSFLTFLLLLLLNEKCPEFVLLDFIYSPVGSFFFRFSLDLFAMSQQEKREKLFK